MTLSGDVFRDVLALDVEVPPSSPTRHRGLGVRGPRTLAPEQTFFPEASPLLQFVETYSSRT